MPAPTLRGVLEQTPLAHLLVHAVDKKLSGSIVLSHEGGASAVLGLAEGKVSKAKTSEPIAHLGRVLLELGHVTQAALDASLMSLAKKRGLHGKLLVESGAVTESQLRHGLRVQLLRKLQHCFAFAPSSTFGFFESFDILKDLATGDTPVDPMPAVWRGICASPSWAHVDEALARLGESPVRLATCADLPRFLFEDDVKGVLDLLRVQPMRVCEIAGAGIVPDKTAKLLVYCLFLAKQLVPADVASSPTATASPGSLAPPRQSTGQSANPPANRAGVHISLRPEWMPDEPPTSVRKAVAAVWPDGAARVESRAERPGPAAAETDPESLFRRAEEAAAQLEFARAEALCRKAHEAAPTDARYLALLAWLESRRPQSAASKPVAEIFAMLDRAIALDSACERAFFYRAHLHKQLRRDALAARDFFRALELDPTNAEALREVQAHERRGRIPR